MDSDSFNIIDKITDIIVLNVNPSWNKLQKIRYVYLELGKYLEKNSDFFLNDRLDDLRLSKEEMIDIYSSDKLSEVKKRDNSIKYQVICKSAALILKKTFEKLNIASYLIHTTGEFQSILHWFLVVKDDNNNQYFLTLVADLPYIKNNMPTLHFATPIKYLDEDGNKAYVIPDNKDIISDDNGIIYKCLSKNELQLLDKSIGYDNLYELDDINLEKELLNNFVLYIHSDSMLFDIFRSSFNIDNNYFKRIDDIKDYEVTNFKIKLNNYIGNFLDNKFGVYTNHNVPNYEDYLKVYLIIILESLGESPINYMADIKTLLKNHKSIIQSKDNLYKDLCDLIQCVIIIENRFDEFVSLRKENTKIINQLKIERLSKSLDKELNCKYYEFELKKNNDNLNKIKKDIGFKRLLSLYGRIAYYFDKDNLVSNKNSYLSLDYIVNKFCIMFPKILDCNFKFKKVTNETININEFCLQNYSEQIIIVRELLKKLFPELSYNNSCQMENYDNRYSPVDNRIQTFPYKNRKTGEYCIGFCFNKSFDYENVIKFIYIPSENLLREVDILIDNYLYLPVSKRFNDSLLKIENIELLNKLQ